MNYTYGHRDTSRRKLQLKILGKVLNDRIAFGRRKYFNATKMDQFPEEKEIYVENFYFSSNQKPCSSSVKYFAQ